MQWRELGRWQNLVVRSVRGEMAPDRAGGRERGGEPEEDVCGAVFHAVRAPIVRASEGERESRGASAGVANAARKRARSDGLIELDVEREALLGVEDGGADVEALLAQRGLLRAREREELVGGGRRWRHRARQRVE